MAQETDFEEEIFEEFEDEEPAPKKSAAAVAPPKKPNTPNLGKRPVQAPAQARVAPVENIAPEVPAPKRYNLYAIPSRTGIFDAVENRPMIEADTEMALILAMMEEILNRLNKLEERI